MAPKKHKILIVDDQTPNLRILECTFKTEGFDVLTAKDVESAQAIILAKRDEIDLVLSDIQMPGLTGFDLVRWAKSIELNEVPILLITSQLPEPKHRIFGLALGAVDYVLRALDPRELVLRVRRSIEHFSQLRALRTSLDDSQNLAAVGRLMAASNHEVKNLAQMIKFASAILSREMGGDRTPNKDTIAQGLHALKEASTLLGDVTKNMQGMIGNAHHTIGPIDVSTLTKQVIEMVKPLMKGVYIDFNQEGTAALWAEGCTTPFKQLLINLILNAKEAIREISPPEGGLISITISETADQLQLSVTDNGVGFPHEEIRTNFPAFATTKQMRGGKGLGLWLSNQFAITMGGSLSLSSSGPGKGACACVLLKRGAEPLINSPMDLSGYFVEDDF